MALDGVTEKVSHGQPCWFTKYGQFAVLTNNLHGDGMLALTVSAPEGMQAMLVESEPENYKIPPYVGSKGWVLIRLDRDLAWEQVTALIEASHRTKSSRKNPGPRSPAPSAAPLRRDRGSPAARRGSRAKT